jgi:2-aminoethylphosphonate-pyruvate transaminase
MSWRRWTGRSSSTGRKAVWPVVARDMPKNHRVLTEGLRNLGLETLIDDALQSPIIVTVHCPDDPAFDFQGLYDLIKARGFIIYPGKITEADTFRVGCIGQVFPENMAEAIAAIGAALDQMGVRDRGPVARKLTA